ncbi:MAG: hypothetical protein JJ866_07185 [Roseibium sp.]|uniref:hypothetical protein n=1 Tax=Roseibium sp. TaxID=1936156 RepID=UPI001B02D538|nr:hypothetical protein [Roseibium sp.]MBO6891706.1 hypothetical protein [Roseibium sp.]MBO6929642.1 hypothetical protein [Roseibium sp.]
MALRSGRQVSQLKFAAGFAVVFGVLTVFSGGLALFAEPDIRSLFGDTVRFVLLFNFLSGFVYVLAGFGLWHRRSWAVRLSVFVCLAILGVFVFLGLHILGGGAYEIRTIFAMTFRAICWLLISLVAVRQIGWNS